MRRNTCGDTLFLAEGLDLGSPPDGTRRTPLAWGLDNPHLVNEKVDSISAYARTRQSLSSRPTISLCLAVHFGMKNHIGATWFVLGTVSGSARRNQTWSGRSTRLSLYSGPRCQGPNGRGPHSSV